MAKAVKFNRIFALLKAGKTAKEIIDMGFPERTVYWVLAEMKKGKEPEERRADKPDWVKAYEAAGRFHDCGNGRRGIIDKFEVLTEDGVIYELRCCSCDALLDSRFVKWTPASKDRYLQYLTTGKTDFDALTNMRLLCGSVFKHF